MEFPEQAKQEYDKLLKELRKKENEVQKVKDKLRPYKLFLEEAGIIEKITRTCKTNLKPAESQNSGSN